MPARRYEVRVRGRLTPRVRDAFADMDVAEAPAETVIGSTVADATQLSDVLALIDSLGLHVLAVDQIRARPVPPAPRRADPELMPGG